MWGQGACALSFWTHSVQETVVWQPPSARLVPWYALVMPSNQLESVFRGVWAFGMPLCVWFHLRGSRWIPTEIWIKRIVPQKGSCCATSVGFPGWHPSLGKFSVDWLVHIFPTSWRCPGIRRWKTAPCYRGALRRQHVPATDGVGSSSRGPGCVRKWPQQHAGVLSCSGSLVSPFHCWGTQSHRIHMAQLYSKTKNNTIVFVLK